MDDGLPQKQRKNFGVPLFAVVTFYLALAVILSTSVGWGYGYSKGKALTLGMHALAQKETNIRVQHDIEDFVSNAEFINSYQAARWTSGKWNLSDSRSVREALKNQLVSFRDIVSGVFFVPVKTGIKYGFYFESGSDLMREWDDTKRPLVNYTEEYLTLPGVNLTKAGKIYDGWPSPQNKTYIRLSFLSVAITPQNERIIVGTDITNESFQNKLMDALSSIKFPFVIAVIDVLTGYIIATTVPTLSLVNPAGTIKRYNETTVPYFEDFSLMLSSTYGGNITNLWRAAAEATGTLPFRSSLMSYSGTVKDLHRDQNMTHPWMIVSYVNEDAVNQAYLSADKWTQSTIFLVMLVLLIVGSMFFIAFTLGLQRVVNHLKMVRDLRFKDLESPRKSLGKASVVRELDVLQNAFIEMLECLMDHKRKRSISHQEDRRLMSRSMPEVSVGLAGHGFTLGSNYFSSGGMNTNFIQTGPAPPVPEIPSSYLRSRKEN